ncbi:MAG: hypothetical protein ABWY78_06355 [Microvirga sp.]
MTTLQLAERLVLAVLSESRAHVPVHRVVVERLSVALLDELRRNDCWFCRVTEDNRGVTVETPLEDV